MKIIVGVLAVGVFVLCQANAAIGMEKDLEGSKAELHEVVVDVPGSVEIAEPYRKAINLHSLNKKEIAYWNPHMSKYITDGDYSYLWCVIYKENKMKPAHHWVAVATDALNRALALNSQFPGGVAFYRLWSDKKKIVLEAYPYSTVHAMTEGKKIVDVNE